MKRYKITPRGYVWDRAIPWTIFIITIGVLVYIASLYNFDFSSRAYVECNPPPLSVNCKNPFYEQVNNLPTLTPLPTDRPVKCEEDWCKQKYLDAGVYGTPEPDFLKHPIFKGFLIFCLMVGLNHVIHNRKRRFIDFDFSNNIVRELSMYKRWLEKIGVRFDDNKNN